METDRLREFVVVAKHGRLASAARELHSSTSTLSSHILSLENELGGKLFDRENGFSLTPAGVEILEMAQRVLIETDAMKRACRAHRESSLTLRVPNYSFGLQPYLTVKERFLAKHPDTQVSFRTNECQMMDSVTSIEEGLTDIACLYTVEGAGQQLEELLPEGFSYVTVGRYRTGYVSSVTHRLGSKQVLDLADMDGATIVVSLCSLSVMHQEAIKEWFAQRGVHVNMIYRKVNRHDDVFGGDMQGFFSPRFIGATNVQNIFSDEFVFHDTTFDLETDVHLIYDPRRLDDDQLAYVRCIEEAAAEGLDLLHAGVQR